MIDFSEMLDPLLWGLSAVAAAMGVLAGARSKRDARFASATLFALAAFGLLAAVAVASWLPPRALLVHPDGSTGDPRAISCVVLGLAALTGLAPALRSLKLPQLGLLGVLLPGFGIAGLVVAVSYFLGLRAPIAMAGILLGGVVLGAGLALFARVRWSGLGALSLQLGATGLLLVAAVLSLNGARAPGLELREGAPVDTLGHRVVLGAVKAPSDSVRRMEFMLVHGKNSSTVWTSLEGRAGRENRSVVGGSPFGGPILVPIGLQELRPRAHDLVWLSKGDSTTAESSTVTFVGFRIVPGDTVRMVADLDVTTAGRTERVSPGMTATSTATTPYAAHSSALGPITVGKLDADNGRVALMLPTPSASAVSHVVTVNLHLRPALPFAWLGGALVGLFFLLGLAAPDRGREAA